MTAAVDVSINDLLLVKKALDLSNAPILPARQSVDYPLCAALSLFRKQSLGNRYGKYTESTVAYLGPGRGRGRRIPGLLSPRNENSREQPRRYHHARDHPRRTSAGRGLEVLDAGTG